MYMETTAKLYSLPFTNVRTYLFALLFAVGNIVLPQLCHLLPAGGPTLLPIYFFTLVGAYKYGVRVGLLTALLSPVANHCLFGMPAAAVLTPMLVKSVLLALAAGWLARKSGRVTLGMVLLTVLSYQLAGTLFEWAWYGSLWTALQDFRIGVPGMMLQWLGGWLLLRAWTGR